MNHDLQKLKNKVGLLITVAGLDLKGGNTSTNSNTTVNYSNKVVSALYIMF